VNFKLNTDQINYLNIGLMLLSAGMAFAYPFELFLFVYAVLGPLHYLTEISWLHDKNYYTKGKYDYAFLGAASLVITALFLGLNHYVPKSTSDILTYLGFVAALLFLLVGSTLVRLGLLVLALVVGILFAKAPIFFVFFGLLLPTLIHVFVFTGFFILVGALRGKSLSGMLSLLAFVIIACGFIFIHPEHAQYHASDYVRDNYGYLKDNGVGSNVFISMNLYLINLFGLNHFGQPTQPLSDFFHRINDFIYGNPAALALMSFVAFAYTYHYFNWFSKTSIIRWHEVSRNRAITILAIWVASLVLYGMNYSLGFKWLFFLSFAHVFLEFPLDHLTMITAVKETTKIFTTKYTKVTK
jgi:hypothetical protein